MPKFIVKKFRFQHTAPEGGCDDGPMSITDIKGFNTQRPKAAAKIFNPIPRFVNVSTHSARRRLRKGAPFLAICSTFQHTAPEGGCLMLLPWRKMFMRFNTQRPKAAALIRLMRFPW
ncbi:hypothetical protein [Aggregatibacter aphrophilus]|uniref:hypothetical protein n=1 Tax=Aggregatibacter aphrophilus TaxID=732 RepID=UPI0038BB699B